MSTEATVALLACVAGPVLVLGGERLMAVAKVTGARAKAKRATQSDRSRMLRYQRELAAQLESWKVAQAAADRAGAPLGPLDQRIDWLANEHRETARQVDVLRADQHALRALVLGAIEPPPGVQLGAFSAVECLIALYRAGRDEASKVIPAVVAAAEGAMWRAWQRAVRGE